MTTKRTLNTGKPKGTRQKPMLSVNYSAGFRELALSVTIQAPEHIQKAAKYLLKLADYLESDAYKDYREKKNTSVAKFRKTHGN